MKQAFYLLSALAALSSTATASFMNGTPVRSLQEGISCQMRELSPDETKALFRNEEMARYAGTGAGSNLNEGFMQNMNKQSSGNGDDDYSFDFNKMNQEQANKKESKKNANLKRLHLDIRPLQIQIHNKSNEAITIPANNYVSSFIGAGVPLKEVIDLFPNFRSRVTGLRVLGGLMAACSLAGLTLSGALPKVAVTGGGISLAGGIFWFAGKMENFADHVDGLALTGPRIVTPRGEQHYPPHSNMYVIPAGATFRDTLFVCTSLVSLAGATGGRPTLQVVAQ